MFVITDGKRNDIGSTMEAYAAAHLGKTKVGGAEIAAFGGDALTVNGYLGEDGIRPLLETCRQNDAGIIVLVKTSNPSSGELQDRRIDGETVYRTMGSLCEKWGKGAPANTAIPASARWWALLIPLSLLNCGPRCRIPSSGARLRGAGRRGGRRGGRVRQGGNGRGCQLFPRHPLCMEKGRLRAGGLRRRGAAGGPADAGRYPERAVKRVKAGKQGKQE